MIIRCPSCTGGLNVPDNALGKKIRCPRCQTIVQTSAPVMVDALPADDDTPAATDPLRQAVTSASATTGAMPRVAVEIPSAEGPSAERPADRLSRDERPASRNGDDFDDDSDSDRELRRKRKKKKKKAGFFASLSMPGIALEPGMKFLIFGGGGALVGGLLLFF